MMTMHTLARGQERQTFERAAGGFTITRWSGVAWLIRIHLRPRDALAYWRRLRRLGYRPAPRD